MIAEDMAQWFLRNAVVIIVSNVRHLHPALAMCNRLQLELGHSVTRAFQLQDNRTHCKIVFCLLCLSIIISPRMLLPVVKQPATVEGSEE
jgi:hypothetical protein